jgi:hypothetical protein
VQIGWGWAEAPRCAVLPLHSVTDRTIACGSFWGGSAQFLPVRTPQRAAPRQRARSSPELSGAGARSAPRIVRELNSAHRPGHRAACWTLTGDVCDPLPRSSGGVCTEASYRGEPSGLTGNSSDRSLMTFVGTLSVLADRCVGATSFRAPQSYSEICV